MSINIQTSQGLFKVGVTDYNELTNIPITNDSTGDLSFTDKNGNVIVKIDKDGLHTTTVNADINADNIAADSISLSGQDLDARLDNIDIKINESKFSGDYNDLINTPITDDGTGALNITDPENNVILKVDSSGLYTTDIYSNGKKLENFSGDYNDLINTPIRDNEDGKLSIVDDENNVIVKVDDTGISTTAINIDGTDVKSTLDDHNIRITTNANKNIEQDSKLADLRTDLDNLDFSTLPGNPIQDNEDGTLSIVDKDGNISVQVNDNGVIMSDLEVITKANISNIEITTAIISDETVNNSNISNANIDSANVTSEIVNTSTITDATITNAHITNADISSADINSETVGTSNIGSATIGTADITTETVGTSNITTATIGTADITTEAVGTSNIGSAEVGTLTTDDFRTNEDSLVFKDSDNYVMARIDNDGLTVAKVTVAGTDVKATLDDHEERITDLEEVTANYANSFTTKKLNVTEKADIANAEIDVETVGTSNITTATIGNLTVTNKTTTKDLEATNNVTVKNNLTVTNKTTTKDLEATNADISSADINSETVGTSNIGSATIEAADITTETVGTSNITTATIGTADITAETVGTSSIGSAEVGTLTTDDFRTNEDSWVFRDSDNYVMARIDNDGLTIAKATIGGVNFSEHIHEFTGTQVSSGTAFDGNVVVATNTHTHGTDSKGAHTHTVNQTTTDGVSVSKSNHIHDIVEAGSHGHTITLAGSLSNGILTLSASSNTVAAHTHTSVADSTNKSDVAVQSHVHTTDSKGAHAHSTNSISGTVSVVDAGHKHNVTAAGNILAPNS